MPVFLNRGKIARRESRLTIDFPYGNKFTVSKINPRGHAAGV